MQEYVKNVQKRKTFKQMTHMKSKEQTHMRISIQLGAQ